MTSAHRYLRTILVLSAGLLNPPSSTPLSSPLAAASTCDCITINSWTTLRSVVQAALSIGALGTRPHILLCPFAIDKSHDESTLQLSQQIFIQCMKDKDGDECVVSGVGGPAEAVGPMVEMNADNVWLQGLTLTGAKGGAVVIGEQAKGAKLIDMDIIGNSSPDNQEGSVVDAKWGSLSHIIDTTFTSNRGTALQNRGTMMVVSSRFVDNVATPFFDSSDNIEQGSGVGGAIMNSEGASMVMKDCCFNGNKAETDGPAIWAANDGIAEVGGTCASGNVAVSSTRDVADSSRSCDGVFSQEQNACSPFNACGAGVCSSSTI